MGSDRQVEGGTLERTGGWTWAVKEWRVRLGGSLGEGSWEEMRLGEQSARS